jgi:hypothetical protein
LPSGPGPDRRYFIGEARANERVSVATSRTVVALPWESRQALVERIRGLDTGRSAIDAFDVATLEDAAIVVAYLGALGGLRDAEVVGALRGLAEVEVVARRRAGRL